jgi:hypothetical protein
MSGEDLGQGRVGIPLVALTSVVEDTLTPSVVIVDGKPHLACVFEEGPDRLVKYCPPDGGWGTVGSGAIGGASIAYDPAWHRLFIAWMEKPGLVVFVEKPVSEGQWTRLGE